MRRMQGAPEHPVVPDSASVGRDLVDESGGRFGDRYVLRSRLGSGCSSSVYAVRDLSGGDAACKLAQRRPKLRWSQLQVRPPRARPASHTRTNAHTAPLTLRAQRHFEHEVKLLRMCVHPRIIGCRGLYMGSEDLAIVLDLMPGGDCQQLLKRHGALAEPAVHTIMEQLFDALTCVHAQGILHRDVKLENILVTTAISPQIKVRHAATHQHHTHTHARTRVPRCKRTAHDRAWADACAARRSFATSGTAASSRAWACPTASAAQRATRRRSSTTNPNSNPAPAPASAPNS